MRFKAMTLHLLGIILLSSCWIHAPIEENMSLRKQAVETARDYFNALENGHIDRVIEQSIFPYWLDGDPVDAEELKKELEEESHELSRWKLIKARFYTREDIEIFAPRMLKQASNQEFSPEYFVVLQFTDKNNPNREAEGVLFFMVYQKGHWKIQGLED